MKLLLIGINMLLGVLLCWSGWSLLTGRGDADAGTLQVGKKNRAKSTSVRPAPVAAVPPNLPPDAESAGKIVIRKNIFDAQRCSGAVGMRGGRSGNTLTLVGVYSVGDTRGAIILSKSAASRNVAANRIRNSGGGNNNTNRTAVVPVKQFFRVGDTLPNGYTLNSVEPDKATLVRGSSKMELQLAQASENAAKTGSTRRTAANPVQQMLQLMQQSVGMQQMQQMNMMRMMQQQRNNNSTTPARSGSTNSRNRSR